MEVAFLIGRKIGRQWLSMTNPLRPYFWLNEGIGVLLAMDIIDKVNSLYIYNIISLKNKVYFLK